MSDDGQMTHEEAQNSPQTADRGSRALPDATDAGEALVQQIAEAAWNVIVDHPMWIDDDGQPLEYHPERELRIGDATDEISRAVLPLVEAQVAPLRDEVAEWEESSANWQELYRQAKAREDAAESALRQVREDLTALADQWERGIPCDCGHSLDTHNGFGCYERLSYEPLVKCDCKLTDDRHDGMLAGTILRRLARVGAADTQPEGAGDIFHPEGWSKPAGAAMVAINSGRRVGEALCPNCGLDGCPECDTCLNCPVCGSGEVGDCVCGPSGRCICDDLPIAREVVCRLHPNGHLRLAPTEGSNGMSANVPPTEMSAHVPTEAGSNGDTAPEADQ